MLGAVQKSFPVVQPSTNSSCLLYIRSIGIQLFKPNANDRDLSNAVLDSMTYGDGQGPSCGNRSANTTFEINLTGAGGNGDFKISSLSFRLVFQSQFAGFWRLAAIENVNLQIDKNVTDFLPISAITLNGQTAQAAKWAVNSVNGYSFACSITNPAWVSGVDPALKLQIGLVLIGVQVQPFDARNGRFTRNVDDCVPTFSVGSWMGIVVSLVLATALLLSWLMLNSVQTMDRFDDPKQKQIVINVKE